MRPSLSEAEITAFRERLCAVAERLFAEQGVPAVSMRQLASALGCSATAAYRYFRDKEEILAAVRTAAFDRFAARLERAVSRAPDARQRGVALGDAHLRFLRDEPHAYRLMFELTQPDEVRYPELQRAAARTTRVMTEWVEQLVREGVVHGAPLQLAWLFWAAIHGLAVLYLAGKLPPDFDLDAAQRETMRLLVRGTRRATPPPGRRRKASLLGRERPLRRTK